MSFGGLEVSLWGLGGVVGVSPSGFTGVWGCLGETSKGSGGIFGGSLGVYLKVRGRVLGFRFGVWGLWGGL